MTFRVPLRRCRWIRSAFALTALILVTGTARATDFVVATSDDHDDGTCDSADCTLREAIFATINNPGEDRIVITFSGSIDLASVLPALSSKLTIVGSDVAVKRNSGGNYSVFTVSAGATVTLEGLTISNGGGTGVNGGAIFNLGTLTLNNCTLSGNNTTRSDGSGSGGNGGAIISGGMLTANNCTFNNNTANKGVSGIGGFGGAISNGDTLIVNNSTFNHNTCSQYGGAIFDSETVTLNSSTFTDNEAALGGGAVSDDNGNETVHINFCTIAGNRCLAADGGGGLDFSNSSGTVSTVATLTHTILAGNTANGTLQNYETNGTPPPIISHGYNLSDDAPSGFGAGGLSTGDQINKANVNLDALGDYGGPTQTMALLNGSAAINAGDPDFGDTPATDQRGFKRVSGGRIDIGAFEVDMAQSNIPLIVTNNSDDDDGACTDANCSLREAIAAISSFSPRTIEIPVAGPIVLASALPDLTDGITLHGTNPDAPTAIDGDLQFRHFVVPAGANVTLFRLQLIRGHSGANGGSIKSAGTLMIEDCTLSGNTGKSGGAIENGGTLTINRSTLSGNASSNYGGAIFNGKKVTLTNSTVTDNDAALGGGGLSDSFGNETFVISHCTIAGNRNEDEAAGGGIDCFKTSSVTLTHTILAGNTANGVLSNYVTSGTPPPLISNGYNLSDDAPSGLSAAKHDLINKANVKLEDLADNGGPTQTMALLSGSAALNTGNPSFSGPPSTDQRGAGFPRVQAGRIDIGAFESDAGAIAFDNATYQVNENQGKLTFNIVRTGGSNGAVSVLCSTSNGTAQAGKDYTAKSATVSFADGEAAKTFTVAITNDSLDEDDETFVVTLSTPTGGASLGSLFTKTATIFDEDPVALVSINNVTVTEGNTGAVNANFAVTLNKASGRTVTVDYATADGTATAGSDYTATTGTLSFTPAQISKAISVAVKGDLLHEPDETFTVHLGNPNNAAFSKTVGVGTILDSDPAPTPTPTATPSATPSGTPTPTPSTLGNISTRLRVETGDNVLIGGFIITGTQPKKVILRAIGLSLPVSDALQNPLLELHGPNGSIAVNDNWVNAPNKQAIIDTTVAPSNNLEAATLTTLPANNSAYTAVVRGVNNGIGVGLVEVFDLDRSVDSELANISTRGLVQTEENVMIGGFIVLNGNQRVIVRAIGPSLPVQRALQDPTLELHDQHGTVITNDNWRTGGQQAEIIATAVPPTDDREAAIVRTLAPGNYTAVVRGVNSTTGVALVEVYALN
jgi:CSLREA domain-containing protein